MIRRAVSEQVAVVVDIAGDLAAELDALNLLLVTNLELTPRQVRQLVDAMARVGGIGAAILARDLERTARREAIAIVARDRRLT